MPDLLALDLEERQLSGVDAQLTRGGLRVRSSFRLDWPEELRETEDIAAAGAWLKQQLESLGVKSEQVVVSIPRSQVVVRQLDVPDVPDEELPELVRLQAETKASASLANQVLDFLPLPRAVEEGPRQVLLVTIPTSRLQRIRGILAAAGRELVSVGISPIGTAELVARAERASGEDANRAMLIVAQHGKRVEISFMRQSRLLFMHSTQVSGDDPEHDSRLVLAEIRRSQGALLRLDPDFSISRAWVVGTERETALLRTSLAAQLSFDADAIDPLSNANVTLESAAVDGTHAPYAGPVGLLLARGESTIVAVDFLNPRKSIERPDTRKRKLAAAAAAAVVLVAALVTGVWWRSSVLDDEIAEAQDRLKRLEEIAERGQPALREAKSVADWNNHSVDALERIQNLNDLLQGTDRVYLVNLRFNASTGDAAAHLQATGYARSREDVEDLGQRLSEAGYKVQPREIVRSEVDRDYPYQAEIDVVVPVPSEEG